MGCTRHDLNHADTDVVDKNITLEIDDIKKIKFLESQFKYQDALKYIDNLPHKDDILMKYLKAEQWLHIDPKNSHIEKILKFMSLNQNNLENKILYRILLMKYNLLNHIMTDKQLFDLYSRIKFDKNDLININQEFINGIKTSYWS